MKKQVFKNDYMTVSFKDRATAEADIFAAVMAYYQGHEAFSAESIMQMDMPVIDAPQVLADLADSIFDIEYKENS